MSRVANQKRKKWCVKELVSRKWRNWYQNEVDDEMKGVDSRVERSDHLFLERMMMVAEQE